MDTKVQEIIFFVAFITVILLVLAILGINLLLVSRNRRLKHRTETLELKANFEKELMKTQVEVAEQTLTDIARDLHDDVGQMLTLSIIQLNHLSGEKAIDEPLKQIRETVQSTLNSVRSISKTLSNDYITSFGIRESLNRLFERLEKQKIIQTELNFPESVTFQSNSNELFAFRIIQELVSNTIKHANATKLRLSISQTNGTLDINYFDDGKGLDAEKLKPDVLKNSLGFTNIFRRAEMMDGEITLQKNSGAGFYLRLTIPNS